SELLAQLPKSTGSNRIYCSRTYAMHFCRVVARERSRDLAVCAVHAAHTFKLRTGCTPNAGCCPLLGGLFVVLGIDNRLTGLVNNLEGVDFRLGHVADQSSHDASRMHGEGADSFALTDRIQSDSKKRVGSLRLSVSDPGVIFPMLKIGIMKID